MKLGKIEMLALEVFTRWELEGITHIGVEDGIVKHSWTADTTPGVLESARARGVTVLATSDTDAVLRAILSTVERVTEGAMDELKRSGQWGVA